MKLIIVTNSPAPYRIEFYNELAKECDVTVIFEEEYGLIHHDSWKNLCCNAAFLPIAICNPEKRNERRIIFETLRYLKSHPCDYLLSEGCMPPLRLAIAAYCRMTHRSYWVDADGGFPKNGFSPRELAKRFLYGHAAGAFSSGEWTDKYFLHYGVKRDRLHRYPFTSLTQKDIDTCAEMRKKSRQYYKDLLGIKEEKMIISVGRFIPSKGYDILLKSAVGLPKNVGIYIIGGKPTAEYLALVEENELENVHFIDFILKDELNLYYLASDIFAFPTRTDAWGLVINEAMARGLPVISTDMCIAALELIKEGINGSIIHVDDVEELHNRLVAFLADEELCICMGMENCRIIREYTTEKMAKAYFRAFEEDFCNRSI